MAPILERVRINGWNRNEEMVLCSFCGKNQEEVKIIAVINVFICNRYVACHKNYS